MKTIQLLIKKGEVKELLEDMLNVNRFSAMRGKEDLFPQYFKNNYDINENMVKYNFNAIKGEEQPYKIEEMKLSYKNNLLREDILLRGHTFI